jgi:hypothetical protein
MPLTTAWTKVMVRTDALKDTCSSLALLSLQQDTKNVHKCVNMYEKCAAHTNIYAHEERRGVYGMYMCVLHERKKEKEKKGRRRVRETERKRKRKRKRERERK